MKAWFVFVFIFLVSCATSTHRGEPILDRGLASWYGTGLHGRRTANGERFNMHALTAAHRTLPFGTLVRVFNLTNGKSVVVRINDRGPVPKDRVIDLSYMAAKQIDMLASGEQSVEITLAQPDRRAK